MLASSGALCSTSFTYTERDAYWYLHLNEQQSIAFEAFHSELQQANLLVQHVDDKYALLRFLKARQWDVTRAKAMYIAMAEWRRQTNVDELYASLDYPELQRVLPHYPHFYHKCDRFGRPVYIELVGKIDCAKLLQVTTEKALLDYHVFTWERFHRQLMPACTELAGKPICTASVILDLAGLGVWSFSLAAQRLLSALAHIDQDYYPESLGVMFIINTPFIFKTIWAFVNPMLEERTRKKIHVLGTDYLQYLKEVIPEENLPQMFGGKSVVEDYMTSAGPWTECKVMHTKPWLPVAAQNDTVIGNGSGGSCLSTDTLDLKSGMSI